MIHAEHFKEISRRWSVLWHLRNGKPYSELWGSDLGFYPHSTRRADSHFLIRDNTGNSKRPLFIFERKSGVPRLQQSGVSGERAQYQLIVRTGSFSLGGNNSPWWTPEDDLDIVCEILKDFYRTHAVEFYDWRKYDPTLEIPASLVRESHLDFRLRYTGDLRLSEETERTQNKLIINFSLEEQQ